MKMPIETRGLEPPPFLKTWRNVNIAVLAWLAWLIFAFYEFTQYFS